MKVIRNEKLNKFANDRFKAKPNNNFLYDLEDVADFYQTCLTGLSGAEIDDFIKLANLSMKRNENIYEIVINADSNEGVYGRYWFVDSLKNIKKKIASI